MQHSYCWQSFAFHEFQESTAAGRDVGNFIFDTEQVDSGQRITTASDGECFAVCNRFSNDFGTLTEVREYEHANRAVPQDGFGFFQQLSHRQCGFVAEVHDLFVILNFAHFLHG